MATSKPIYQGYVYQNGSLYCALYKREIINISASATVQWYWMPSNKSGDIINYRDNALNGFFSSEAAATNITTGVPSGYSTFVDDFAVKKVVGHCSQFPFDGNRSTVEASIARTKYEYLTAKNNGAYYVLIFVDWGSIFTSYSQQTTNSGTRWAAIDDLADYAVSIGLKVCFRISTALNNALTYAGTSFVNGSDAIDLWKNIMQDEQYYPCRSEQGSGHVSLAYTPGVDMAKDFVKKVLQRYNGRYGSGFLWYSVAMTAHNEAGYNFTNARYTRTQRSGTVSISSSGTTLTGSGTNFTTDFQVGHPVFFPDNQFVRVTAIASNTSMTVTSAPATYSGAIYYSQGDSKTGEYNTSFDHSPPFRAYFITWLQQPGKYATIGALNTSWGTSYGSFADVETPKSGATGSGAEVSNDLVNSIYKNNRGKDFWQANYDLLKSYLEYCHQLGVTYAPNAKFVLEWATCTQPSSAVRRMSILTNEFGSYADMAKMQLGFSTKEPDLAYTVDAIRTNCTAKYGTELNGRDPKDAYGLTDANEIEDVLRQTGYSAIDNGAKDILIIADSLDPYYQNMVRLYGNMAARFTQILNPVITSGDMTINLGQLLENPSSGINQWKSLGGSTATNSRKGVTTTSNPVLSSGGCQFPLSIYDNHSFCLKTDDRTTSGIKSFVYTNADGTETSTAALYKTTKVRFLVPTHAITYTGASNQLGLVKWRIVGADGITYISNLQTGGWYYVAPDVSGYQPAKNNNHPDRRYPGIIGEDSIFYLPIQNYTVYMTNLSAYAITFQVDLLNPNSTVFRKKLTSGMGEQSYAFGTTSISFNEIRQVKINCNRYTETDSTWADI